MSEPSTDDNKVLPKYVCHKEVWAMKIQAVKNNPTEVLLLCDPAYAPIHVSYAWVSKFSPEIGGYWVRYKNGYESYSPADAFEEGYTLM